MWGGAGAVCWGLLGFVWSLLGFARVCLHLLRFTTVYYGLLGFIIFLGRGAVGFLGKLDFAWVCSSLLGFVRVCRGLLGFAVVY